MNRREFIGGVAAGVAAARLPVVGEKRKPCAFDLPLKPAIAQQYDIATQCWMVVIFDGVHVIWDYCTDKQMVERGRERVKAETLARAKRIWNMNSENKVA